MTEIKGKIRREVRDRSANIYTRDEIYTVEIAAEGIYIREKGSRTTYGPVSWGSIFLKGAELKARSDRQEKATTRSIRKVTRNLLT